MKFNVSFLHATEFVKIRLMWLMYTQANIAKANTYVFAEKALQWFCFDLIMVQHTMQ